MSSCFSVAKIVTSLYCGLRFGLVAFFRYWKSRSHLTIDYPPKRHLKLQKQRNHENDAVKSRKQANRRFEQKTLYQSSLRWSNYSTTTSNCISSQSAPSQTVSNSMKLVFLVPWLHCWLTVELAWCTDPKTLRSRSDCSHGNRLKAWYSSKNVCKKDLICLLLF